ncbi:hypothetical protein [Methylomonas sp. MgM2]
MNYFRGLLISLICSISVFPAMAMDTKQVPELLKPWIPWVMSDQPDYQCPFFYRDFQKKQCSWTGKLQLDLEATGGRFSGEWVLYQAGWIFLPGDDRNWPQQVSVNQTPAIVIEHNGKPAVWREAGHYQLRGTFLWEKLPERLTIPDDTGLIELHLNGKTIAYPRIDRAALWLSSQPSETDENRQNNLNLQVFRQIVDDNPLQIITRLELNVSGRAREVTLSHALLPDFIPIKLDSPLPARIEKDGRLLVQVRAGRWTIDIRARHPGYLTRLDFPVKDPDWPETELWAFQAMPALRLVEIDNLSAIDASQTNMPPEWRHLPAYQVEQGQSMHFKLIRKGDPEPEPNQLNLERKLWLDFDGGGYTVNDNISGNMTRDWRLNVVPEIQLGQALLNGQNQLITRLDEQEGIEVRRGALQLQADSRIQTDIGRVNAVGWQQSFRQARAELNIPPGWRLLAVAGVDNEPDSWLTRWTLLDLFLVLITGLTITRLWSWQWGALALFSLMLFWHEADAPRLIWLHILAAVALLRVLPDSRFYHWVKWYRNACWLILTLIVVPFMIAQIRVGIYPQLEKPWQPIMPASYTATDTAAEEDRAMPMQAKEAMESIAPAAPARLNKSRVFSSLGGGTDSAANFDRIDPEANLQTGPGLPQWQWQTVQLSWNGAVDGRQTIRLWYLPPFWTMLMHILQALLAALMTLQVLGVLNKPWKSSLPAPGAWILVPLLIAPAPDSFADIPDQALLEQLKQRLLQPPECLPSCAQIPSMNIDITAEAMLIQLQVDAQENLGVPLPAQLQQWFPEHIAVDGKDAEALVRQNDGSLWLGLAAGVHGVVMHGRHAPLDKFTLPLPLTPQHTRIRRSEGWRIDGLYEDGKTGPQLEFKRLNLEGDIKGQDLNQAALPPFIRVERTLHLGLDWSVTTRIVRLSGSNEPVVLELPLLTGEAVTDANVRLKDGKVLVNMAAGQHSLEWSSMLEKSDQLTLKASDTTQWSELWRADVSPIWHLQIAGIAAVHHQDNSGAWMPEWRPWPGESVALTITRPQAVPGPTLTIDKSRLKIQPSKRSLVADLILDLRSSKGGQHTLRLPPAAMLQNVGIDGISQAVRQKGDTVTLPIRPGAQQINLNWQMAEGLAAFMTTPTVDLGVNSVNSHIQVLSPDDRWVLLTLGPKFGPAALIWGLLIVLLLISIGLGRVSMVPLKTRQWFLLFIGLSQLHIAAALTVAAWLFALGLRERQTCAERRRFNLAQAALALLTLIALLLLFGAVQQGLLGTPDMQISGNESTATTLNWYQDHADAELPTATVVSVPMMFYRLLMLAWSLWMAISLLDWLRWGWGCFSRGGIWRKKPVIQQNSA